jgi:hypothetical protein
MVTLSCRILPVLGFFFAWYSAHAQENPDFNINDMMNQNCPNFRCSAGDAPVPQSRPKFTSTGCNTMGGGVMMMSPGSGKDDVRPYAECCDQWHACYQVCGVNKATCDTAFETCAKQACGPEAINEQCHKDVNLNNMMMKIGGCQKFNEAQLQACECKPKDQAPAQREAALRYFYKKQAPENVDKVPNLIAKADSPSKLAGLFVKLLRKYPAAIQHKEDPMQAMYDKIRMESTNEEATEETIVDTPEGETSEETEEL